MKTYITSHKHLIRYSLPLSLLLVMNLSGCNSEEKNEETAQEEIVRALDSEGFCIESNELQLCVAEAIEKGTNTVLLKEQVYLLTETILLADNLKIAGKGSTSVVTWHESVKDTIDSPLFYTTTADNVELSNFKITGTINQDANSEDLRNDHIGVFFECEGDPAVGVALECNDVTIKNLEVENCSHGIHIKGTQDVTAIDLNLHNNGNTEVDLFHNIYYRRVSDVYMAQTDENVGGFYNSPRGHGIRATNLHNATFDNLQVYGNADHGVNFGEIYNTTFNHVDIYDNCANPAGNCSQIQCYAEPCDLTIVTDVEPVLPNIVLTVNDTETIDISWNLTGLHQEATKVELFRNTINATSGRSLVQAVEKSGIITDSSILVSTQYWYMLKIQFANGETLNSEIAGPIIVPGTAPETNLTMALGSVNSTVDLTWELNNFPDNISKVELYRNTAETTSGRTKVADVEAIGSITDTGVILDASFWYMFKITLSDGSTINTDISGPIILSSTEETNLAMAVNTNGTAIDVDWSLVGFPYNVVNVELFRNTVDVASGRTKVANVDLSGQIIDTGVVEATSYWYMFKISLSDGTTINSEITGPICISCT